MWWNPELLKYTKIPNLWGGGGGGGRTPRHTASHCRCSSTATGRAIEHSRFGSPQGERFVVNAVQIGAGPSYSVGT